MQKIINNDIKSELFSDDVISSLDTAKTNPVNSTAVSNAISSALLNYLNTNGHIKYKEFTSANTKAEVYEYFHALLNGTSSFSKSIGCIGYVTKSNVINEVLKITDNGDSNIDFYDITNNLTLVAYSTQTSEYLEGDLTLLFIVP